MATIHDVAREAGVSLTTVSFVLNNGPRPVNVKTRQRVREAIERLNYQPSAVAQGLARRRLGQIGLIFSDHGHGLVSNEYGGVLLEGMLDEALDQDLGVLIVPHRDPADDVGPIRFVSGGRVDGCILVAPVLDTPMITRLVDAGIPTVGVSSVDSRLVARINLDNAAGVRLATEHLLQLGHRRIAHVAGDPILLDAEERRAAFLDCLAEAGVTTPSEYLVTGTFHDWGESRSRMAADVRALLRLPQPPTAVFCANDTIAGEVIQAAKDAGISVPYHLSVVGFDASRYSETLRLTSARQPTREMGRLALRALADALNNKPPELATLRIAPTLIIRETTAPPYE